MTPFIAITPADWAQIEAGHEWLGLGHLDLTCPTCKGGWNLRCDRCGASASLPLGMTCDDHHPGRRCPAGCWDGKIAPQSVRYLIVVGHEIVAVAETEMLPVRDDPDEDSDISPTANVVLVAGDRLTCVHCYGDMESGPDYDITDISDAPGVWTPGGWGAHFTGITTTTGCPDNCTRFSGNLPGWTRIRWVPCGRCNGAETLRLPLPWTAAPDRPTIGQLDIGALT